ncbi:MAG: hypothetical protein AB7F98_16395 [Novosphingobium sp.]
MTARHSLHLRFAGFGPKTSPSVFSDAAAGIAVTSIRLNSSFSFKPLSLKKFAEFFPFDTRKLRPKSESRKKNLWMFSTARRFCSGELGLAC